MLLHFIEKRLLTLFLDDSELRNFTIVVKDAAAVDALWICISFAIRHEVCRVVPYTIFGVRLLRCSFNYGGQCEGLESWDE